MPGKHFEYLSMELLLFVDDMSVCVRVRAGERGRCVCGWVGVSTILMVFMRLV